MNCRGGEKLTEDPGSKHAKENLNNTCRYTDPKGEPIGLNICGWILSPGKAKFSDTANCYDNKAGCRSFDREF